MFGALRVTVRLKQVFFKSLAPNVILPARTFGREYRKVRAMYRRMTRPTIKLYR